MFKINPDEDKGTTDDCKLKARTILPSFIAIIHE